MVSKIIMAMFLPGFLVIFFTRVTFNHFLGLGLTVALIAASAYKGYTHTWPLIIIDAALLIEFGLSTTLRYRKNLHKRQKIQEILPWMDKLIVVKCDPEIRLKRLEKKGFNVEKINRRLKVQLSQKEILISLTLSLY